MCCKARGESSGRAGILVGKNTADLLFDTVADFVFADEHLDQLGEFAVDGDGDFIDEDDAGDGEGDEADAGDEGEIHLGTVPAFFAVGELDGAAGGVVEEMVARAVDKVDGFMQGFIVRNDHLHELFLFSWPQAAKISRPRGLRMKQGMLCFTISWKAVTRAGAGGS